MAAVIDWNTQIAGGECTCHPTREHLDRVKGAFDAMIEIYPGLPDAKLEAVFGPGLNGRGWNLAYRIYWWSVRGASLDQMSDDLLAGMVGAGDGITRPWWISSWAFSWALCAARQIVGLPAVPRPALRFVAPWAVVWFNTPIPACTGAGDELRYLLEVIDPARN